MNKEEIQVIVDQLDKFDVTDGRFGIYQYGGGPDESYVKANKEGLIIFAKGMLLAALQEEKEQHDQKIYYQLLDHENDAWVDDNGTVLLNYVEVTETTDSSPSEERPKNFRFIATGCLLIALLAIVMFFVGIVTTIGWLGN